jgi:hypothetical protein
MGEAIKLNESLQKEAREVISKSNLENIIGQYGEISYGGSYVYGTMVDRDIDLALLAKSQDDLTIEIRNRLASELLNIPDCVDFSMSDRKSYPKPHRPKGVWFGPVILHNKELWNIDIWLVSKDEPLIHSNDEMSKKLLILTEEKRSIILEIKYLALKNGTKKKGVTSGEIYKAVLAGTVSNYDEWEKYQKEH